MSNRVTNIDIEKLRELAKDGHGFRALGEYFGVDRTTIINVANRYSIKVLHAAPYVPLIEKPVVPPPPPPPVKRHPYEHLWTKTTGKNYEDYVADENARRRKKGVRHLLTIPTGID